MRRGRPPKSSALKLLQGIPGRRPLKNNDPDPAELKNLRAPTWLDEIGRKFWRRHAPELARLGLLTILDHDLLAAASERWSVYRRGAEEQKSGLTQNSEANGRIAKPECAIAKQALQECRAIMADFGCSPSSRTRVTPLTRNKQSRLNKFLGGPPGYDKAAEFFK